VIKSVFDEDFIEKYINAKKAEWDSFRVQVTQWELDRYMQMV
jgi:glutamine synthetase